MPVTKWVEMLNNANIITKRLEPDFVAKSEAWVGKLLGSVAESFG